MTRQRTAPPPHFLLSRERGLAGHLGKDVSSPIPLRATFFADMLLGVRTNFEHGTKIPLMIGCPGGKCVGRTPALVQSIDIMPTVLEEAGLSIPPCPSKMAHSRLVEFCTEGRSLSPLLREPQGPAVASFTASYSQFPRPEHPGPPTSYSVRSQLYSAESCQQTCLRMLTSGCSAGDSPRHQCLLSRQARDATWLPQRAMS